jgi:hypothetical protein
MMQKHYGAFWAAYDVPYIFGISLKYIKMLLQRRNDARKNASNEV